MGDRSDESNRGDIIIKQPHEQPQPEIAKPCLINNKSLDISFIGLILRLSITRSLMFSRCSPRYVEILGDGAPSVKLVVEFWQ